jgi:hypothetical protein
MVRSHLSTDRGTKVAYQILQGAKVPSAVQVPLLDFTKKELNAWMNASPATGVATPPTTRRVIATGVAPYAVVQVAVE